MENIFGNITEPIFGSIGQEIGYQFSCESNVDKLKDEVQKLIVDRTDKQRIVEDAKRNNQDIAAAVRDWLNRVQVTIAKAHELINEGDAEVRCLKRRRLSKDAEKMAQQVSEIIAEGRSHQILSFPAPPQMTTSSSARGYEALESRTSMLSEIKQALQDPNINRIGVHGMGGVGKTTLMKELAWQAKTERLFEFVVIVTSITNAPDFRRIQGQVADGLGLQLTKETEEGRAGELRGRISGEKSILIILDDIWDELDLTKLGVDDHKVCKLVLTSRDLNVLSRKMNTQKDFPLEVFSEGESWTFFEKITEDVVKHQNIKSIAVDVVKCCAGLPLLVEIVAKDLRKEQDVHVWKDTLTRLQSNNLDDKVHDCLKMSYERLKSKEHKSLFLLIGTVGRVGIGIRTEELLQVCWGLGIYRDVHTLPEARNRQHSLLKDLRASSLLLDGETKWVRMHDLVHDVAKSIAYDSETHRTYARERFAEMNEWPKNDQNYNRIILRDYCISELPEKLECPKLEVLLLRFTGEGYLKIPDNIFSEMGEEVKVLYLRRMKLTKPPPPSLCRLARLRSLNLSESKLEGIAIIGELASLEILILEGVDNLEELPKEIGSLTSLRVLNVNRCYKLRLIPKNLLSSLNCLEELYMEDCPIEWEDEGSNNHNNIASLAELRNLDKLTALSLEIRDGSILPGDLQSFEKLERYYISIFGVPLSWKLLLFELPSEISRILMLGGTSTLTIFSNVGIKVLLTRAEGLYIKELECVDEDDFMKVGQLFNSCPELRSLTLETMKFSGINTCKIWDDNLTTHPCSQNLTSLDIQNCGRLTSIFSSSVARALENLEKLKISLCKKLKMIFVQEDISREEVILPNLEELRISKMDELESLWPSHMAPNSYCKLSTVEISYCNKLLNVFPSHVLNNVHNLKALNVSRCDKLEDIFEIQEQSTVAAIQQGLATRLSRLTLLGLPKLKHIWSKDPQGILRFQNLSMVDVSYCESLDYVFPFSVSKGFQRLQELNIHTCGIEKIFDKSDSDEVKLVPLEKLKVWDCGRLKNIVPPSLVFQNLNVLRVSNCNEVVNITSLSKLRVLEVSNCDTIEEIIASENDGDASSEIAFMNLENLELTGLLRLKSFCGGNYSFNFPSLKKVHVSKCPMMETFCNGNLITPDLAVVTTSPPLESTTIKDRWDGDLNTTIRKIFDEKSLRRSTSQISKQGPSLSSS